MLELRVIIIWYIIRGLNGIIKVNNKNDNIALINDEKGWNIRNVG